MTYNKNSDLAGYNMYAIIHTICIKTLDPIDFSSKDFMEAVNSISQNSINGWTYIILNLNKLDGFINSYTRFTETLTTILKSAGIKNYVLLRADMSLDSYEFSHYLEYAKLNRLIISMLAQAYSVKNKYRTLDLFTNKQLSVAIKNPNSFEVENYDKCSESNGSSIVKSRFEIRSLRMGNKNIVEEFIVSWNKRFKSALACFDATLDRYNTELLKIYNNLCEENINFKWVTFFAMYENCIFTRQQAIKLLNAMGIDNPEEKYKYYKKTYKLVTYKKRDIENAIDIIKKSRDSFFQE